MKKTLVILFLTVSVGIYAQTTWYIDPAGSDATGTGTLQNPWNTLYKASTSVTTSGDIIHVNAGTYNETYRTNLAVGVSIVGEGDASHLEYNYAPSSQNDAAILLNSTIGTTSGDQSISYVKIDGKNYTATRAICVNYRSNVLIHHCTITGFNYSGITFDSSNDSYPDPPTSDYATGNKVYNCTFIDCTNRVNDSGQIRIEGQDSLLVYNNVFDADNRSPGSNGNCITTNWNKKLKIYNNTFYKLSDEGSGWNFFFEAWHWQGDGEIYGNTFNGGAVVDIVNVEKGIYQWGLKIYDNEFLIASQITKGYHTMVALDFEERGKYEYIYIYNNHFKNYPNCIYMIATMNEQDVYVNDIYIYCNILENVGYSDFDYCYGIFVNGEQVTYSGYVDNINIWNNTILSGASPAEAYAGIYWGTYGTIKNIFIRNNIIRGFSSYPIRFDYQLAGATIDTLSVENNLYYLNSTNAAYYSSSVSITHKTEQNNNIGNPYFFSINDYHLTSSSTLAIDKGISVGLSTDYDGVSWGSPPSIGAYEYVVTPTGTVWYIDPNGSDATGNGSSTYPWKTLAYACAHVTTAGHIIHVNPGTYIENTYSSLAPNVSIEGSGSLSIIKSHYQSTSGYAGLIRLVGSTNSAQHISYITLDGDNLTGYQCIGVYQRSNVEIHHCTIKDFRWQGICFGGSGSASNRFHDNTVTNCSGGINDGFGDEGIALKITQQTDFLCYNNIFDQSSKGGGYAGIAIGGYEATYGTKIYNNNIIWPHRDNQYFCFAIEFWSPHEMEIYDNTIDGETDICKLVPDVGDDYTLYFHDNIIGGSSILSAINYGLQLEANISDVIICNNMFKNLAGCIYICNYTNYGSNNEVVEDLYIYANVMYNVGISISHFGKGIYFECGNNDNDKDPPYYYDNINIWNNTIIAYAAMSGTYGIDLPCHARSTSTMNIDIKNNIIVGFYSWAIGARQQDNDYGMAIDHLNIQDNVIYNNGNSNNVYFTFTPTNYTNDGGIKSDPLFESSPTDLHLTSTSPAIHTGTIVSLPYDLGDYDGVAWNTPPSIGGYEYASKSSTAPVLTTAFVTNITGTSATCGGTISSDGGESVILRGVCWSTGHNPTILSEHTSDGADTGTFVSYIINLTPDLVYYVRAYATNSVGTAYGNERSFTATEGAPSSSGNVMKLNGILLKFGNQLVKLP